MDKTSVREELEAKYKTFGILTASIFLDAVLIGFWFVLHCCLHWLILKIGQGQHDHTEDRLIMGGELLFDVSVLTTIALFLIRDLFLLSMKIAHEIKGPVGGNLPPDDSGGGLGAVGQLKGPPKQLRDVSRRKKRRRR